MKSTSEIIARSVINLCISDRCALEKSFIEGKHYSKKKREEQRMLIIEWLESTGYYTLMTASERLLFTQKVGSINNDELSKKQLQYEAIEPCLWSIGLKDTLSNYDNFVIEDFHQLLHIGLQQTLDQEVEVFNMKSEEEIVLQKKIAMLWHWRAIECYNSIFMNRDIGDVVNDIFGQGYEYAIKAIIQDSNDKDIFLFNNKKFNCLNKAECARINNIAYWRHHAFEWIAGDENWDETEVNT